MSDYDYIDKGSKTGTILGQSSSKLISFYGIQPISQKTSLTAKVSTLTYATATTQITAIVCTATSTVSSGGFVTTAEFSGAHGALLNLQTRIGELETDLKAYGIIAGGTAITTTTAIPFDFIGAGGGGDGMILGASATALIGFYGITPCSQPSAVATCSAYPNIVMTATSTWGLMDATISIGVTGIAGLGNNETHNAHSSVMSVIANCQARLATIETNLTTVGLLAGGTAVTSADSLAYDYLDGGADTGTIFGRDENALIGFWAATPVDQAAALTTAVTAFVYVSSSLSVTYVIATAKVGTSTFKWASTTAGNTFLYTVVNCRTRLDEIETALNAIGLQAT